MSAFKKLADGERSSASRRRKNSVRMKKKFDIQIYKSVLWLVVADDVAAVRKTMAELFGNEGPEKNDWAACASYDGTGNFGLFFERRHITPEVVAHECFHVTHRILDYVDANFDSNHHETAALLHGYIMDLVMREIYTMKVKRK